MAETYYFECPEHGEHIFDPDARCTAIASSTGERCRQPVFPSQRGWYMDAGVVFFDSPESWQQAAELRCWRHLSMAEAMAR